MKILKLKFKNLNSLYGEWSIDFTDEAYVQNGIFALTGPTGAGKSTILDAICLALYGCTARLDKITKSSNEIMSRQTAESHAEVEFISQAGQFLCRWSQRRSRGKVDGSLQETQQEIAELMADGKHHILATKKKEFDALVEEKTGMDFDRFLRSMLLAQGKFDHFLKADAKTKSAVLEKITGTSIYSEISQRVHKRSMEEDKRLEVLRAKTEGIHLLSGEEREESQAILHNNRQVEAQLQSRLKQLQHEIHWHQTLLQLRQSVKQVEQQFVLLEQDLAVFSTQREQLQLALKAQELQASYSKVKTLRDERTKVLTQQASLQATLPQLQQALKDKELKREQVALNVKALKKEWEEQAILWKQVRALDIQVSEQTRHVNKAIQSIEDIQLQWLTKQQEQEKQEALIKTYQQQLQESEQYLKTHSQDKDLLMQLSGWKSRFDFIQKESLSIKQLIKTQTKTQEELRQLEERVILLKQDLATLQQEEEQLKKRQKEQEQELDEVLQGQTIDYYQQALNHAREKKALIQNIHDVAAIREKLVDNEPCPVCGSTHHPYQVGIPPLNKFDEEIAQLTAKLTQIQRMEDLCRDVLQNIYSQQNAIALKEKDMVHQQQQVVEAQQLLNENQESLQSRQEKLKELEEDLLLVLKTFQIKTLDKEAFVHLDLRLAQWQEHTSTQMRIMIQLKPLEEQKKALQAEQKLLRNTLDSETMKLAAQEKILFGLQQQRKQLFGDTEVDSVEQTTKARLNEAENTQEIILKAYDQIKTHLEGVQVRLHQLEEAIQPLQQDLRSVEEAFKKDLCLQGFSDEIAFQQALLSREALRALQEKAQQLDHRHTELKALKYNEQERLSMEEGKQLSPHSLETLEIECKQLEPQLRQYTDKSAAVEERLRQDRVNQDLLADKQAEITKQEQEALRWKNLKSLIGSADGSLYRNFAQGLTFELMIHYANQQLRKMSDRYVLLHDDKNVLSLNVLDAYQAGEVRSVRNLSGGESFMVSLALALGLSKMSSQKIQVDSLFLDEGFGTLDEETLDNALDTLSGLHEENKLIGIISHVPALKNRISTQIQVEPLMGGRSRLSGPGVTNGA